MDHLDAIRRDSARLSALASSADLVRYDRLPLDAVEVVGDAELAHELVARYNTD
jgi:hypothetical protein